MADGTEIDPKIRSALDRPSMAGHRWVLPDSCGGLDEVLEGTAKQAGLAYLATGLITPSIVVVTIRRVLAGRVIDINIAYNVSRVEGTTQAMAELIEPKQFKLKNALNWALN